MAFINIEDLTGNIEAVSFPKLYQANINLIESEKCVAISGKIIKP